MDGLLQYQKPKLVKEVVVVEVAEEEVTEVAEEEEEEGTKEEEEDTVEEDTVEEVADIVVEDMMEVSLKYNLLFCHVIFWLNIFQVVVVKRSHFFTSW